MGVKFVAGVDEAGHVVSLGLCSGADRLSGLTLYTTVYSASSEALTLAHVRAALDIPEYASAKYICTVLDYEIKDSFQGSLEAILSELGGSLGSHSDSSKSFRSVQDPLGAIRIL